jgi:poly(3-hydroxybutyrate) depolymerase
LVISLIVGGLLLSVVDESLKYTIQFSSTNAISVNVQIRILAIFAVGCVGGTTFSIKWLVHAVAKRKWHLDRRYWRFFVPAIGGVYACVVLTLAEGGLVGAQTAGQTRSAALTAALAFLVGYFSDGVSGLLSNVANAVFGTLEKK